MIIDDYFKDLKKKIYIYLFFLIFLICYTICYKSIILGIFAIFLAVCLFLELEYLPTLKSKIDIDYKNNIIKLIDYPVIAPDERDKRGYVWRNKTVNIHINQISNYEVICYYKKIFFKLNNGQEFLIQSNFVELIKSVLPDIQYLITQKDIGKIVQITDADGNDDKMHYSGKIINVINYKNKPCKIVDTNGYENIDTVIGNILLLFNRSFEHFTGNRDVNVLVLHKNIVLKDELPNLKENTEFTIIGHLKFESVGQVQPDK